MREQRWNVEGRRIDVRGVNVWPTATRRLLPCRLVRRQGRGGMRQRAWDLAGSRFHVRAGQVSKASFSRDGRLLHRHALRDRR